LHLYACLCSMGHMVLSEFYVAASTFFTPMYVCCKRIIVQYATIALKSEY